LRHFKIDCSLENSATFTYRASLGLFPISLTTKYQRIIKKYSKNTQKILKEYSKYTQRLLKEYSNNTQRILKEYSKNTQRILKE